jgi:hypothetical protein
LVCRRLVKNSWGPKWGVNGYIMLSKDDDAAACGILEDASYPIMDDTVSASYPVMARATGSASGKDCGGATAVFSSGESASR